MKKKLCHSCGASMMSYRHSLNHALVVGLLSLFKAADHKKYVAINLKMLGLTRNQWDNFQKLRYWNLVEKGANAGTWQVTNLGADFIERALRVPSIAISYRGNCIGFDGSDVGLSDHVPTSFQLKKDYAAEAEPYVGK